MPHCPHCGEIVGIYEPVIQPTDADGQTTSLAREPWLAAQRQLVHQQCMRRRSHVTGSDGSARPSA